MQKELLRDAVTSVAGKHAEDLVNYIDDRKYINEFLIAKKFGITINQLRNILYKLSEEGMVSSVRKKDKRKGWYTYFWKIEALRTLGFLRKILEKRINQVTYQMESRQKKNFYICERCKIEFNDENALLQNFTCSECGEVFALKDNKRLLKELAKNLDKQIKGLHFIEEEIIREKEHLEKKKMKEIKKEKRLKAKKITRKTNKKSLKKKIKPKRKTDKVKKTKTKIKKKNKKSIRTKIKKKNV